MYSINRNGKHDKPALTSVRLLDQLRERLRYLHYSLRTEKNYVYWVRWFVRWHGVRHPREMGGKDRVVMLPIVLKPALKEQLAYARAVWDADRQGQRPGVFLPHALGSKYPRAGQSWIWQGVFPSPTISRDPQSGINRRHFLCPERLQLRSNVLLFRLRFKSMLPSTYSGIHSRRICSRLERTSERCRNCRHSDVGTTVVYTHVLKIAAGTTRSPLDSLIPTL
jgi:hypothetical protein